MKKFAYLLATGALIAACSGNGYSVTGSIEGAQDGETVYLNCIENRKYVATDSATIQNGVFTFEGTQPQTVSSTITYQSAEMVRPMALDIFLENGDIKVKVSGDNVSVTGTENNNLMQAYRDASDEVSKSKILSAPSSMLRVEAIRIAGSKTFFSPSKAFKIPASTLPLKANSAFSATSE